MRLARRFSDAAKQRWIPWTAMLELGQRCNLRCVHCYNFDRSAPGPLRDELDATEWRRVMEALRAEGCHQVGFTGGEALVFPGVYDLIEHAAILGMAVSVVTNATLPVERLASYAHVVDVGVSVYGAREATHDAITGVAGSFRRTMASARFLRDAATPVTLKFVVMRSNLDEIAGAAEAARREGFIVEVNPYLHPRHDGDAAVLRRRVDPGAYIEPPAESPDPLICGCARSTCAVTSRGDVTPCLAVPMACGNVREMAFGWIWAESPRLNEFRRIQPEDFESCHPCELRRYCRRSNGPAYLLTGSVTGVDPWACEDAAATRDVSS